MFGFRKIWCILFSCNTRFEIRPLALLPTKLKLVLLTLLNIYSSASCWNKQRKNIGSVSSRCSMLFQVETFAWKRLKKVYLNHLYLKYVNPLTTNVLHHTETSHLICIANQVTGFYIMQIKWLVSIWRGTLAVNGLRYPL